MDILKSKTVNGSTGTFAVIAGVNEDQIIAVFRQGIQKDKGGIQNGNNWIFVHPLAISFGSNFKFSGTEIIKIIYKVTT